ncbi:MAG: 50S ribosomal protein L9 [Victivallales bacterium]|jgi:large subunit ribosomal protein L9|nr:50S ribosomal protein L9 [Victivallales bacterium]
MAIELILLKDVAELGKVGDIVRVAPGYARNYLLPKKFAEKVNPGTLRRVEAIKLRLQKEHEERVAVAQAMAEKVAGIVLSIPVEAGENGKLFGSVNAQMIAEALKEQGVEVEKNIVQLDEPLRELGEFDVELKLHAEVKGTVKVNIVAK